MSYPLYDKTDEIKTGSIDAPAPEGQATPADAVVSAPLAPPAGASAAAPPAGASAAAPQAATPVAYAAKRSTLETAEPAITPSDWAYARGALSLAMGADAVDASVPWANPDTGSYGSFKASAGTVVEHGAMCRPFAASHSGRGQEQRLEGTACRTAAGHWEAVAIRTTASRTL
ncbi:RT0821/Lpp0805 family surface protein [Hansschlegelia zhihuaiae]|uniref:RT0821/Lpp0805 family surface protein n=1 Tax=Hansschlegelia zhihuaiae TaxID=405005 RepID=UPI001FE1594A|nr:RT0821/Lpp0805 family surface protein [Hansschlegelia zhihuaiae]